MSPQSKASKLNFLKAQRDNYRQCGHFSEEEIATLQAPLLPEIEKLERELQTEAAKNIETIYQELKY